MSRVTSWLYVQAYFARRRDFSLAQAGDIVMVHLQKANLVNDTTIRQFAQYKQDPHYVVPAIDLSDYRVQNRKRSGWGRMRP